MNKSKSSSQNVGGIPVGGLSLCWLLAEEPKSIRTKSGEVKTVIELRDPMRLSRAVVIWLEGDAADLAEVPPNSYVTVHVRGVRSGRNRGELVADVSREAVVTAFAAAEAAR